LSGYPEKDNVKRPTTPIRAVPQDDGLAIQHTPAMAAGVADHIWTPEEIVELAD
jgi:hypothetical protein